MEHWATRGLNQPEDNFGAQGAIAMLDEILGLEYDTAQQIDVEDT